MLSHYRRNSCAEMKKLERCPKFDSRIKFENDSSPLKAEEKGAAVDQAALDETSWALFDESSPADATGESSHYIW
jgi:hypothetical protein